METSYLADHAWLGPEQGVAAGVLIAVEDGRISSVDPGASRGDTRLPGLTIPGLVNCHSHAFHRALRARSEAGRGDFWTWRALMYAVAEKLDPDTYRELATAVYAEMALAGITSVGEFHYLHHDPTGRPYADPNTMGTALIDAAEQAGMRITLIDTCYLRGGMDGRPLEGAQLRFDDRGGESWAKRLDDLRSRPTPTHARLGAAIHSVRAVPPAAMETVATYAARYEMPLHVHLSEQQRENEECLAVEGCSPTELLRRAGALTAHTTAVHATHLLPHDITLLGLAGTTICACPTTERDLADGIGPFADLVDAGCPLSIGSDSHAIVDPFEEMRGIELNERLERHERGLHDADSLLVAGTSAGAASIGWPETGRLAAGALADFVTLSFESPRLAGTGPTAAAVVYAAAAADVRHVVVGGRRVVVDGRHALLDDPAHTLDTAIKALVDR